MNEFLKNKTILITGGTGFLGNALLEHLLKFDLKAIRILSNDEFGHFKTQKRFTDKRIRYLLGDIRNFERMKTACDQADIVIHAAALKRIDLIEYNVLDGIETNVNGTVNVVRACLEKNVEKAIFISTDKACSPINLYGATKMIGERVFIESNYNKGSARTALIAVRYGNVANSTGSVVPFFCERIKEGKDIPITDKRMTRFIISEERAVQEVMDAIKYGVGGEIFVPKLASHTITDLAEVLRECYSKSNKIKIVGIRAGEKIHECMINEAEAIRAFDFQNHYVIVPDGCERFKLKYPYLDKSNKVPFESYCSKDFLIGFDELKKVLLNANVLD